METLSASINNSANITTSSFPTSSITTHFNLREQYVTDEWNLMHYVGIFLS